jgi:hypothetical protein
LHTVFVPDQASGTVSGTGASAVLTDGNAKGQFAVSAADTNAIQFKIPAKIPRSAPGALMIGGALTRAAATGSLYVPGPGATPFLDEPDPSTDSRLCPGQCVGKLSRVSGSFDAYSSKIVGKTITLSLKTFYGTQNVPISATHTDVWVHKIQGEGGAVVDTVGEVPFCVKATVKPAQWVSLPCVFKQAVTGSTTATATKPLGSRSVQDTLYLAWGDPVFARR